MLEIPQMLGHHVRYVRSQIQWILGSQIHHEILVHTPIQWIGLRENLQENPILNGKIYGFL